MTRSETITKAYELLANSKTSGLPYVHCLHESYGDGDFKVSIWEQETNTHFDSNFTVIDNKITAEKTHSTVSRHLVALRKKALQSWLEEELNG